MYLQKGISIKTWRKNCIFCWHLEGHWWKEQDPEPDPHPDPLVKGADPTIRIRTKMSQIWNTAKYKEITMVFSILLLWKLQRLLVFKTLKITMAFSFLNFEVKCFIWNSLKLQKIHRQTRGRYFILEPSFHIACRPVCLQAIGQVIGEEEVVGPAL